MDLDSIFVSPFQLGIFCNSKTVNTSTVQQILKYEKLIFCLYFNGKVPQSSQEMNQPYAAVYQRSLRSLFTCLDRVKDTVKHSLPEPIFTSVLRPRVVLQKLICLSAAINSPSLHLWFSTHQRALPSEAAVPGSRYWHWKQKYRCQFLSSVKDCMSKAK